MDPDATLETMLTDPDPLTRVDAFRSLLLWVEAGGFLPDTKRYGYHIEEGRHAWVIFGPNRAGTASTNLGMDRSRTSAFAQMLYRLKTDHGA